MKSIRKPVVVLAAIVTALLPLSGNTAHGQARHPRVAPAHPRPLHVQPPRLIHPPAPVGGSFSGGKTLMINGQPWRVVGPSSSNGGSSTGGGITGGGTGITGGGGGPDTLGNGGITGGAGGSSPHTAGGNGVTHSRGTAPLKKPVAVKKPSPKTKPGSTKPRDIEVITSDTKPGTPWPTAANTPGTPASLKGVPGIMQTLTPWITPEMLNRDLQATIWSVGMDTAKIEAFLERSYGLPPGSLHDTLGLRAKLIGTAIDTIPPGAFGVDLSRTRVDTFPAGTIPNIGNPNTWPRGMMGAGSNPKKR